MTEMLCSWDWEDVLDVEVNDPTGWAGSCPRFPTPLDFETLITRDEFLARFWASVGRIRMGGETWYPVRQEVVA